MARFNAKSFNYAVGMFGTSIPINMLKTYAAFFYVDSLGLKTSHFSLVLLVYTFIDAADNLVYGYLSDRTRTRWGRRRPWLTIGTLLLALALIATMDLISARIMDEDTARYNMRREGIISNALGFMNRLNGLFTSLAFFLILKIFGFESGDAPGNKPDQAARFLLTVFPFCLMLISLAFSFFLHFPARQASTGQALTADITDDNGGE